VIPDKNGDLVYATKTITTPDVTSGIIKALEDVLKGSGVSTDDVAAVMFGTTHVPNAIVQRRGLGGVGVLRISIPATEAIEPTLDWSEDLRKIAVDIYTMIRGGHDYTGEPIAELDLETLRKFLENLKGRQIDSIAVTSVFSVVNPEHEIKAWEENWKNFQGYQ